MADTQSQSAAGKAAERQTPNDDSGKSARAPAEPRSFAQSAGKQAARGAEAMQNLAENSRHQANRAVETWRRTMDPLLAMQMDATRWMDDVWRRWTGISAPSLRPGGLMGAMSPAALFGQPACDLRESDKAYYIAVELPGMTRDDIDLQVRDNLLTLSGAKSEERDEGGAAYRLSERRFGRFERSFPIPPDVDAKAIDAGFKDGVLKITLPRTQAPEKKSERIEIG